MTKFKEVTGEVIVDFMITCPDCKNRLFSHYDSEWFQKTMGADFPSDGVTGDYEATCPHCQCEFTIKGFEM